MEKSTTKEVLESLILQIKEQYDWEHTSFEERAGMAICISVVNKKISSLPVPSVKDKEPDGYIVTNDLFTSAFYSSENKNDMRFIREHCKREDVKPVYFPPVPSNRIGDAEYEKYLELKKSYVKPLSDESIITDLETIIRRETGCNYNYSNDASKAVFDWLKSLASPVSDEVKKPIEEITNEDAYNLAGILGFENIPKPHKNIKDFILSLFLNGKSEFVIHPSNYMRGFKYLQLKNYELPKNFYI